MSKGFLVDCIQMSTESGTKIKKMEEIHSAKWVKDGVYEMKSKSEESIAIFKPQEEEIFADGKGTQGDKAIREVVACMLAHDKEGVGSVPPTTMVTVKTSDGGCKSGSLQEFIPNQPWFRDSQKFAIGDVQRMSLIDLRYGNNDRTKNNILMANDGRLITIDHAECFPKTSDRHSFIWTEWYQAKHAYPSEMVKYVADLDADKDLEILKCNGINLDEDSLKLYKIRTRVLKTGVANGYLPAEIGQFVTKKVHLGRGKIKPKHISDLIEDCHLRQKKGKIEDDEKFYEEIGKGTKEALEFNKRNAPV